MSYFIPGFDANDAWSMVDLTILLYIAGFNVLFTYQLVKNQTRYARYRVTKKFTNETIKMATYDWAMNPTQAAETWGHMDDWDISDVTDLSFIFGINEYHHHEYLFSFIFWLSIIVQFDWSLQTEGQNNIALRYIIHTCNHYLRSREKWNQTPTKPKKSIYYICNVGHATTFARRTNCW